MSEPSSLIVDLRPGEYIELDGVVKVETIHKSGHLVRLRIQAPAVVSIQKKNSDGAVSRGKDARFTVS